VESALAKGGTVSVFGFGTISVSKRKARTGRNPGTGETVKIAEIARFILVQEHADFRCHL
jgi:nucleoid DNA-binding protein